MSYDNRRNEYDITLLHIISLTLSFFPILLSRIRNNRKF